LIKSGFIQAKLFIGKPDDTYEKEADALGRKVMRMPDQWAYLIGFPPRTGFKISTIPSLCLQLQGTEKKAGEQDRQNRTFADYLEEATLLFKSHGNDGLGFGAATLSGYYDTSRWERPTVTLTEGNKPKTYERKGVIRAKVNASEAMTKLVEDVVNNRKTIDRQGRTRPVWSVDCLEFTQLIRVYAYWKTLPESEFNQRFNPLEFGMTATAKFGWLRTLRLEASGPQELPRVVRGTPTPEGFFEPEPPEETGKTWDHWLRVAPVGTHIQWSSLDLRRKCRRSPLASNVNCNWENEHTTKLGKDKYAAWDLGVVTADEIKQYMAAASFGNDKNKIPPGYIENNIFVSFMEFPDFCP
jgi:hypothetical protein